MIVNVFTYFFLSKTKLNYKKEEYFFSVLHKKDKSVNEYAQYKSVGRWQTYHFDSRFGVVDEDAPSLMSRISYVLF